MKSGSTTTRREFLIEAAASTLALGVLSADVLASQQPATATGLPPTGTVLLTVSVAVSMRVTVPSSRFATQTPP